MTQALIDSLESTLETVEAQGHPELRKLQAELVMALGKLQREQRNIALGAEAGDPWVRATMNPTPRKWWCWWDDDFGAMMVQSPSGFFISFSICDGFWTAMQQETRRPGFLRTLTDRVSPDSHHKRLDDRTVLQAKREWEDQHGVKHYTAKGKLDLNLEDLDL